MNARISMITNVDKEEEENLLNATNWIIDARWYYAPLAFFLGAVATEKTLSGTLIEAILAVILVLLLILNWVSYSYVRRLRRADASKKKGILRLLNIVQIMFDLFFFFLVMIFSGGVESIASVFFFVPIVVSVILFGFHGALIVALSSSFLVFLSVALSSFTSFVPPSTSTVPPAAPAILFTKAGIVSLIYLLTGFFGGYITRVITLRDRLLHEEITRDAEQVEKLKNLNVAFDESAKLLVRRDIELYQANQKLTRLDQMKSEIISVVAHQLRTPLSAIKWTLNMLLDGDLGELTTDQRSMIKKGFESNERMIVLINDLLSVDRLDSGKFKYTFVPVQFEDLLRAMIAELLPVAEAKKVHLSLDLPPILLPKIKVDPDKIHDVLQNMIDNAIKYSKEGGTVHITLRQEESAFHLSVADEGIGIPDAEKDKIFARFFRASNAAKTQTSGSGLGLFIALSIVRRHGGKIWFESVEGKGTTFHATFPSVA